MKRRFLALLLSLGLLCSSAGAVLTVEDARTLVENLYIDEVPKEILARETVEELFAGLDQYSNYFSPVEYEDFQNGMNDVSVVGIGIVSSFSEDGTRLEILRVYKDGVAYAAGIRPGDAILEIDGRPVSEAADLNEAANWMRGEEGSRVSLLVMGPGGGRWSTTLTRSPFMISNTVYELVDGHIGYIDCDSFGVETYDHFSNAFEELGDQVDRWILDLRDNGGGLTQVATDVAGIFGGEGNQVLLRDRAGEYFGYWPQGELSTIYPVIVLVNGETASSGELVTAALRDRTAGLIIGSRTFGKGVAQTVVDRETEPELFFDGDAVRITSYRFYSPVGLTNDRIGVLPHLMVEEPYVEDVAYLLSQAKGFSGQTNELELTLGSWHWSLNVDRAVQEECRPAFEALLEAIWPETELILSTSDGTKMLITAKELAEMYGLTGYTSRGFQDAAQSEYALALNVLESYGILRGDGTGNVVPKGEVTRAQMCAMLAQLLDVEYTGESLFEDVKEGTWYFSPVNAMAWMGFVEGDGTGSFHPEETLTNEQMICILARLAAWLDVGFYEDEKIGPADDVLEGEILAPYSDWARDEVWLLGMSRTDFFGNGISYVWDKIADIAPRETALRETIAQSLFRMLNLMGILVP